MISKTACIGGPYNIEYLLLLEVLFIYSSPTDCDRSGTWTTKHPLNIDIALSSIDHTVFRAITGLLAPGHDITGPLDKYLAEQTGSTTRLNRCCSHFNTRYGLYWDPKGERAMVEVRRYLGQGKSAGDPDWVAQCILPEMDNGNSDDEY